MLYAAVNDSIRITRWTITPEGFLDVWGVAAKVGPLDYPAQQRRVWVPPEVLADTSTLSAAPVVPEHPTGPSAPSGIVTARNARGLVVGWGRSAHYDPRTGEQLVSLRIIDSEAIADARAGRVAELSPGYNVGLMPVTDAHPEAKAAGCTHIQVYRQVNHLAMTKQARGGPTVRLFLDSAMTQPLYPMLPWAPQPQMPQQVSYDAMQPQMPMQPMMQPQMPMQAPMPMQQMPMQPQPQQPPKPQADMASWQAEYDALMARKPQAQAQQAAPAPQAQQQQQQPSAPEQKPQAFDSAAATRFMTAVQTAQLVGLDVTKATSLELVERGVVATLVGDSLAGSLPAELLPAMVEQVRQAKMAGAQAAQPAAQAQAPVAQPAAPWGSMVVAKQADSDKAPDPLAAMYAKGDLHPSQLYGQR